MPDNDTSMINLYITLSGVLVLTLWMLVIWIRRFCRQGWSEDGYIAVRLGGLFLLVAPTLALACALLLHWIGSDGLQWLFQREWLVVGILVILVGLALNRWAENRLGLK